MELQAKNTIFFEGLYLHQTRSNNLFSPICHQLIFVYLPFSSWNAHTRILVPRQNIALSMKSLLSDPNKICFEIYIIFPKHLKISPFSHLSSSFSYCKVLGIFLLVLQCYKFVENRQI